VIGRSHGELGRSTVNRLGRRCDRFHSALSSAINSAEISDTSNPLSRVQISLTDRILSHLFSSTQLK